MDVQALVFDVFGTLVDWRSGVAREAERILAQVRSMAEDSRRPGAPTTSLEGSRADGTAPVDGLGHVARRKPGAAPAFGSDERISIDRPGMISSSHGTGWTRGPTCLPPFTPEGALRPGSAFERACRALDCARTAQRDRLGRGSGRRVRTRLQTEAPRHLSAVEALRLRPEQVVMVACHSGDLAPRRPHAVFAPLTYRDPTSADRGGGETRADGRVDFSARDLGDLAGQLGA